MIARQDGTQRSSGLTESESVMSAEFFPTGARARTKSIDLGVRSAEGVEALTRHARIRTDAERQHLLDSARGSSPSRSFLDSLWHAIDRRVSGIAQKPPTTSERLH